MAAKPKPVDVRRARSEKLAFMKKQMASILGEDKGHHAVVFLHRDMDGETTFRVQIAGSPDRQIAMPWDTAEVDEVIT